MTKLRIASTSLGQVEAFIGQLPEALQTGVSLQETHGGIVIEATQWGTLDCLQNLLATGGINSEQMQTVEEKKPSLVVGRESISDAA